MTTEEDHPVGWDTDTPDSWRETVNLWPWEKVNGSWLKRGTCPRCEHEMWVELGLAIGVAPVGDVFARCNCRAEHKKDERGCGQMAMVNGR